MKSRDGKVKRKSALVKTEERPKRTRKRSTPVITHALSALPRTQMALLALHRSGNRHCSKCEGLLVVQTTDPLGKMELRCLNCGWQPQFRDRIMKEPEEARAIRQFTAEFLSGPEMHSLISSIKEAPLNLELAETKGGK